MANVTLLQTSEQLDRYQLLGEIASGGMASVFLGRLGGVGGFQRMVAIKRLHPHLAREREFVEMFLDEARLAASIHHRNVVPIIEIGTTEAGYYLVMEYIEGVTLARLMTQAAALRNPIPRPVLLRIIVDTLSGLHAAHELTDDSNQPMGVVHRDCSPQNILIGLDGCTRITDFGIARASSRLHNTREGAMKGKLAYMAPEQTQGDEFDRRADLFSVAVVLWEILAGRRLFKSKAEAQTLKRLLHDPIPRLTDIDPTISPALASVAQMALERNPDNRFQTAADMADAVESAAKVAARSDEPVATERTVEALMKKRYGGETDAQREELRSFLQATPTLVGPRAKPTDPGWIGPTASDPGVALQTVELTPEGARPGLASSTPPPRSQPVPPLKRSWPVPSDAHADDTKASESEDETHIYDPTSTTGVTADPTPHPDWEPVRSPPHDMSGPLPLVRRRRTPWGVLLIILLGGLGTAAFVAYRTGVISLADLNPAGWSADETTTDERSDDQRSDDDASQARTEPSASAGQQAEVPAASASGSASAASKTAARPRVPVRRRRAPPPVVPPEPPEPVDKPEPAPPPKPPPKPGDGDLVNPYR